MTHTMSETHALLLRRSGLVFAEPAGAWQEERYLQALEAELAELGYALSARLRERLRTLPLDALAELQRWLVEVLAAQMGANQKHVPLFRKFPRGVPQDTFELWLRKVACHFIQGQDQPCLFCGRNGTTHLLSPCLHVVCEHCFDGESYSACPVCERPVDPGSPFFKPTAEQQLRLPRERVRFKRLDLGEGIDAAAEALMVGFCQRTQAMSPADREDLQALVREAGEHALYWLPAEIPLRENVALIFGALLRQGVSPDEVLEAAAPHLGTATDVLRLLAAYSGADPALQRQTVYKTVQVNRPTPRWLGLVARLFGAEPPASRPHAAMVAVRQNRFKVAPLPRRLRRALLARLEALHPDALCEDMLRHRSYWVWLGEFLHPHEYARRYPKVARAFALVRKKDPEGKPAPRFRTYHSRLEQAAAAGDGHKMVALLKQRPGELARRFDHLLRVCQDDPQATSLALEAFQEHVPVFSTPVLLTLHGLLPGRGAPAPVRAFFPKGGVALGVFRPDQRPALRADVIGPAVQAVEAELLERFAAHRPFERFIVDTALAEIVVPFGERTASPAAVSLPRGSRVAVPEGKVARLFLHWCEPEKGGMTTDLDLSVGFYDAQWGYQGASTSPPAPWRSSSSSWGTGGSTCRWSSIWRSAGCTGWTCTPPESFRSTTWRAPTGRSRPSAPR